MAGLREVTNEDVPVAQEIVFSQANRIINILIKNPTKTISDVAEYLHVEPGYVEKELGLLSITDPVVKEAVEDINAVNVYNLSKLPSQEQRDYVTQARTLANVPFRDLVQARLKEIHGY
jgi:hypothetical protein